MAKLSQLEGTPYHIGRYTRSKGDAKRHQARCRFFENVTKTCVYFDEKCHGTAHCSIYKEGDKVDEVLKLASRQELIRKSTKRHYKKAQDTFLKVEKSSEEKEDKTVTFFKRSVQHKDEMTSLYYKSLVPGRVVTHTKFGQGEILERTETMVTIAFEDGEKRLDINFCLTTNALRF